MRNKFVLLIIAVNAQSAKRYVAPKPTDVRGPCPGLNTLANHGYINRNGVGITKASLKSVLQTLGVSEDLRNFLVDKAIPTYFGTDNFRLDQFGEHNILEHDASLVYEDYYFNRATSTVNSDFIEALTAKKDNTGFISEDAICQYKKERMTHSERFNLSYDIPDYPFPLKSDFQYYSLVKLTWFLSKDPSTMKVDADELKTFLKENKLPKRMTFPLQTIGLSQFNTKAGIYKDKISKLPSRSLKIPLKDSSNAAKRTQYISDMKNKFSTKPVFWKIANRPKKFFNFATGPDPATPFVRNWIETGAKNIVQRAELSNGYARKELEKMAAEADVSTIDSITKFINEKVSLVMPKPQNLDDWKSDQRFADYHLTYGGYKLELDKSTLNFIDDTKCKQITGTTLAILRSSNRLFRAEYRLRKFQKKSPLVNSANPFNQFIPDTITYLYKNAAGNVLPLAITVLDSCLTYTKLEKEQDWLFAKLAVYTGIGVFYPTEHFTVTHTALLGLHSELVLKYLNN
jgi:hypothetical protein